MWTLRGKSAWETATILGISEHTVAKIVRSATLKLEAPNKRSAAIKAMKLGLLDDREIAPRSPPQAHCIGNPQCDAAAWSCVDVHPGALTQFDFAHFATDLIERAPPAPKDPLLAPYVARGRTTWRAWWRETPVFVQWSWTVQNDGVVLLEDPMTVTTNARLSAGQDDMRLERPLLIDCMVVIHRLEWQEVVRALAGQHLDAS